MADLMVPVLSFASAADRKRAWEALEDQQFDIRCEADTELSVRPWEDLDDAYHLLLSSGIACERSERAIRRLGPGPAFGAKGKA